MKKFKMGKGLKTIGIGAIIFFTVKGIITTSLIVGGLLGLKSLFPW